MPSVQTNYSENIRPAVAGMQASTIPATFSSRTITDVNGASFGRAMAQDSGGDREAHMFTTGDAAILGILTREQSLDANTPTVVKLGETGKIMRKGEIWVVVAVQVVAGNPVFVRPSNGDFQPTNANSAVQIAGARFETSAGVGELARVFLG